jgi:hypothetical protein
MRYLVDRGTGTIVPLNGDLVIVDTAVLELYDTVAILEIANKLKLLDKAIIGTRYELPIDLTNDV